MAALMASHPPLGVAVPGLGAWLAQRTEDPLLTWAATRLLGPVVATVVVVALASIGSRIAGRAIRRAVAPAGPSVGGRRVTDGGGPGSAERRRQRAEALVALGSSAARVGLWATAALIALGSFGVDVAPLIAGAGIIGVAVGFGSQDVVRDLLAGVSMLLEDQYGVGDVVDAGEAVGVVEGVTLRSTRIRSEDGTLWHVPNGTIRRIGNRSQGWARAVVDVPIVRGADVGRASDLLRAAFEDAVQDRGLVGAVVGSPEPIEVQDLGRGATVLRLAVRTRPGEDAVVAAAIRRRCIDAMAAGGITLA